MKHKHAENMLAYAQDAMETDRPWERWEYFDKISETWIAFSGGSPAWYDDENYRRKKRTISINGYDVPEPVREPLKEGDAYYYVSFDSLFTGYTVQPSLWYGAAGVSQLRLDKGIIHLTQEAAKIHAKALLSFTQKP